MRRTYWPSGIFLGTLAGVLLCSKLGISDNAVLGWIVVIICALLGAGIIIFIEDLLYAGVEKAFDSAGDLISNKIDKSREQKANQRTVVDDKNWQCRNCGKMNSPFFEVCECGNKRSIQSGNVNSTDNMWQCKRCGSLNSNTTGTCGCGMKKRDNI